MLRRAALAVLVLVLTPATVHAFDHNHHDHDGDDGGGGCGSSSTEPSSGATVVRGSRGNAHVFVTSTLFSGAVGSLADADAACQTSAARANLAGSFRAWMSDASANAVDRVGASGALYATNESLVFSDATTLGSSSPAAAILDENGQAAPLSGTGVWTGSDASGHASGHDCAGWTDATVLASATTGTASALDPHWGGGLGPAACNAKASLLCVQVSN